MRATSFRCFLAAVPLVAVLVGCTAESSPAGCTGSFPADHVVNTRVDALPVSVFSDAWIARLAATSGRSMSGAGASAFVFDGSRAGIPRNTASIGPVVTLFDSATGVNGTFMLPQRAAPRIEGEPNPLGAFDHHYVVTDTVQCRVVETIGYNQLTNTVTGASVWNLNSYDYPTRVVADGPPAEAARLPISPMVYTYDEVASGRITHALRMTAAAVSAAAVWPASTSDGRDTDPAAIPMGAHLRLRANADLSALGPAAKVVATAMKEYGMVLADSTVSGWSPTGSPDERWNDADLATLKSLTLDQFEVVDPIAAQANPFVPSLKAKAG